jgi:hypothetical protein
MLKLYHDTNTGIVYADSAPVGTTATPEGRIKMWDLMKELYSLDVYIPQSLRASLCEEPVIPTGSIGIHEPTFAEWSALHPVRMQKTKATKDARYFAPHVATKRAAKRQGDKSHGKEKGAGPHGSRNAGTMGPSTSRAADSLLAEARRWLAEHPD